MGKYFLYQLGMFAEMERDWFRERSKKGREARFREGKWKGGTPPFGYSYNQETGKLEVDEIEAEVVRLIFNKYLKFGGIWLVRNYLNKNKIPTRIGAIWHDSTINVILSRKTYIGIVEMYGDSYEDQSLKLIDYELFYKVLSGKLE